jgi:hypothetical protein
MSSQSTGDAGRPAVPAGEVGGAAAARPEDAAGTAPAGAGAADATEAAGPAPGAVGAADTDTASADAAAADAGRTTIVLDPEHEPLDPEHEPLDPEHEPLGQDADLADLTGGLADDPAAEPVSKLAVLALVTGVLALVPIAVACGIAALAGIRRTGRRGHGMAMAALFVSAAWVIVGGAVGTVGALTHGFKKPVTVKYHESAVFKLQKGECVSTAGAHAVSVLPCSAPHEAEVFATFSLPASAWPGTAAVQQEASSGCVSRLTGYLNPQLAISLAQSYVFPDKVAWTAGTRTVICEVRAASGKLTGSVRGAS